MIRDLEELLPSQIIYTNLSERQITMASIEAKKNPHKELRRITGKRT